ncbi:hypothetical protein DIPPA_08717 [Diplonema papillatum]|nr:hypothetical protein DIPPA_08717 [Diplonema papillatum]
MAPTQTGGDALAETYEFLDSNEAKKAIDDIADFENRLDGKGPARKSSKPTSQAGPVQHAPKQQQKKSSIPHVSGAAKQEINPEAKSKEEDIEAVRNLRNIGGDDDSD